MDLLENFNDFIQQEDLFHPADKLLLAVSGGVDSVVLCELCRQAGYDFIIAHCNFHLRGEESDRDEQIVRKLGQKYGVEVLVRNFDTSNYCTEKGVSVQVAARELRYDWFHELIASPALGQRAKYIVTAHHADDNIETLLMNFFKGTGINGLRAMLPKQGRVVRPLLFARKAELLQLATTHQLAFAEDSSNASDKYTRNYFRNQLIPGLQKVFPAVEDNLADNLQRFRDIETVYRQAIAAHLKRLLRKMGNEVHIPVLLLQQSDPLQTIVYEIIRHYDFTAHQVDDVIGLLKSENGKYIRSSSHRIIRNRKWLIIAPLDNTIARHILIEKADTTIDFPQGQLHLETKASKGIPLNGNHPNIVQVDQSGLIFPLLLRKWKTGDYFYPLGMTKKKKLSRFLIDQKLSLPQKEKVWVLESNKKIVWVLGLRIDDRFKIGPGTSSVLELSLKASIA